MKEEILEEILKAVKKTYPEAKISLEDIELEHPAVEEHGDYSTNIAFKLAKKIGGKKSFLENIDWIVRTINKDNFEDYKEPVPVGKLSPETQKTIKAKTDLVYLKPRIYAKIIGWWSDHPGQKELANLIWQLPLICYNPIEIYKDKNRENGYLFSFEAGYFGILVLEILEEPDRNEIVTAFYVKEKRIEKSFLGRRRVSSLLAHQVLRPGVAGAGLSSLQESQEFYNTLDPKSQDPQTVAEKIVAKIKMPARIPPAAGSVAGGGFINFWLSKEELVRRMNPKAENNSLAGEKIMVEFAHPNTHKELHIGHMRTLITGEALARILEASGAQIFRANYQGDIGPHVAKALRGIKNVDLKKAEKLGLPEKAHLLGQGYIKGNQDYEENKEEIDNLNRKLYQKDPSVMELYNLTRKWSLDYYDSFYTRFYTKFDKLYFESEMADPGKKIVLENMGKVFEKSEGAVVFRGEHTRVFITSDGNPTYEGKEIGLAFAQFKDFPFDKCIHVVANEQAGYFKVVIKAIEEINPKFIGRQFHLSMGMVQLVGKKISSRTGVLVTVDSLLDDIKKLLEEKFHKDNLEAVTIAAVKYSVLKTAPVMNSIFDLEKSVSLEGDSGPYLQYTYARARSVLRKARVYKGLTLKGETFTKEELAILRYLYRFSEVIELAARQYAPNLICSYLFELAKRFNNFYNNVPIIQKKEDFIKNIEWLLQKVNKDNFHNFSDPVAVGKLNLEVVKLLKAETDIVVLKPLIFAKLAGWVQPKFKGHAEVIGLLPELPLICYSPQAIYEDKEKNRYIFSYEISHFGILVVEVSERNHQNEIVTMFLTDKKWAERFEKIWTKKNNSLGRRRISSLQAPAVGRDAGAGLSSLRESYGLYSILDQKSQEEEAFRLGLTAATARVLKTGLNLLGIEALEKM